MAIGRSRGNVEMQTLVTEQSVFVSSDLAAVGTESIETSDYSGQPSRE